MASKAAVGKDAGHVGVHLSEPLVKGGGFGGPSVGPIYSCEVAGSPYFTSTCQRYLNNRSTSPSVPMSVQQCGRRFTSLAAEQIMVTSRRSAVATRFAKSGITGPLKSTGTLSTDSTKPMCQRKSMAYRPYGSARAYRFEVSFLTTGISPHFPYQPCWACRKQQQRYPM